MCFLDTWLRIQKRTHTFKKNNALTRIRGWYSNTLQTSATFDAVHTCPNIAQNNIEGAGAMINKARFVKGCHFDGTCASACITYTDSACLDGMCIVVLSVRDWRRSWA